MTRLLRPALIGVALLAVPALASAQRPSTSGLIPGWERTGRDFAPNGVWRSKGRAVAAARAQALARGDFANLAAPMMGGAPRGSSSAVGGVLRMPALLFSFATTAVPEPFPTTEYAAALYGATPPTGRSYTLRTFYEQMSNSVFSMQGDVFGWTALPLSEASYTGQPGACPGAPNAGNCNGVWSNASFALLQNALVATAAAQDAAVDYGQYDNDGPDGIPNSGDDDGFVDVTIFLQAEVDGACGGGAANNHPWAHRAQMSYTTGDARNGGGNIRLRDYILQSAVGGSGSCTAGQLMPVGTAAHELGHGLGLPDLYDTQQGTEGIGQWGLMGSGNYTSAFSPSRMEAWSLNELGWVTLRPIASGGTYTLGPAPTSDTAFVLTPGGTNLRGERFLIENRQPVQADSAVIRVHCARSGNPVGCGGGLLIWHIDQTKLDQSRFNNSVNSGAIHGLELVQADNLNNLRNPTTNRGDAGDPYPGITANTSFTPASAPAALLNNTAFANGSAAGFAISQIQITGGVASMQIDFGGTYRVNANDPAVSVLVDNVATTLFQGLLIDASTHTLSVTSPQVSGDGRRRFTFASWTDGGSQTHDITATLAGDTITATMTREHKVIAGVSGNGTITPTPAIDLTGTFVAENTPVQLVAAPTGADVFLNWTGDTTTSNATLMLPLGRPYTVTANFSAPVSISTGAALTAGLMGTPYNLQLVATGGTGTFTWTLNGGTLPQGLTLSAGGLLAGTPGASGDYAFTVAATSGSLNGTRDVTLSITQPSLVSTEVVKLIVTGGSTLAATDLAYLDLLGNKNGSFDLGDFLAWVRETGAVGALRELEQAQRAQTSKEK